MVQLERIETSLKPKYKMVARFIDDNGQYISIHFGARTYKDYTIYNKEVKKGIITQDLADSKKDAYIARHRVNEDFENPMTAGALSRWILWNKKTIRESITDFKKRFKF
jgi:hypothetical protein